MSKIGTNNIIGKPFIPIVTTLSFNELNELKENNKSIEITNGIIFSIPQDEQTGEDKEYEGSIWLTDNNGLLYPLTLTIKQQKN